jgi:hypothetical protein
MSNIQKYTPEINEAFKPEVIQVMRNSLAPTATDAEFVLFAHKAASYGLDPFKNEIFFIKYGNTARIQFAAEAYLAKAREKEGFQPPDTQMVHENDEFKVEMNKETKSLEVVLHEIGFPRGKIIGAYSIAYREGYRPVTVISDIEEVDHMFKGQNKDNWTKWTSDMYGKFVQQRALKKQYGIEFGDDEIPQPEKGSDSVPEYQPKERRDITNEVNSSQQAQPQSEPPKQEASEEDLIKAARKEMAEKFKQLGITDKDEKGSYIAQYGKVKGKTPTLTEMKGLLKIMDLHIEEKNNNDDLE